MIKLSLWINIIVLAPICLGLFLNSKAMNPVFGEKTTAREILLSIYLTLLLASVALLFFVTLPQNYVRSLLLVQVFYKLFSVLLIKNKKTPVLWFNLLIAVLHSFTLYLS
jgi:hypothetical protein